IACVRLIPNSAPIRRSDSPARRASRSFSRSTIRLADLDQRKRKDGSPLGIGLHPASRGMPINDPSLLWRQDPIAAGDHLRPLLGRSAFLRSDLLEAVSTDAVRKGVTVE